MKSISIIIPAYNEEKYIRDCLESIVTFADDNLLEVIVVDNGSTDRTAAVVTLFNDKRVRVVSEKMKGPNAARQRGFEESKGEIVATIDADTRIHAKWYQVLTHIFDDEKIAAVSGPIEFYDLPSVSRKSLFLFWVLLGNVAVLFTGFVVYGGNFAARRSALESIGGFNTEFSFYGDDVYTGKSISVLGRIPFLSSFYIRTSARRLKAQGILGTCFMYGMNFLSEVVLNKPYSSKHEDFR